MDCATVKIKIRNRSDIPVEAKKNATQPETRIGTDLEKNGLVALTCKHAVMESFHPTTSLTVNNFETNHLIEVFLLAESFGLTRTVEGLLAAKRQKNLYPLLKEVTKCLKEEGKGYHTQRVEALFNEFVSMLKSRISTFNEDYFRRLFRLLCSTEPVYQIQFNSTADLPSCYQYINDKTFLTVRTEDYNVMTVSELPYGALKTKRDYLLSKLAEQIMVLTVDDALEMSPDYAHISEYITIEDFTDAKSALEALKATDFPSDMGFEPDEIEDAYETILETCYNRKVNQNQHTGFIFQWFNDRLEQLVGLDGVLSEQGFPLFFLMTEQASHHFIDSIIDDAMQTNEISYVETISPECARSFQCALINNQILMTLAMTIFHYGYNSEWLETVSQEYGIDAYDHVAPILEELLND
ncbi:hypothetical protein [Photobacterium ganghwense]|uniref:hypothetical protein n=1 Tax=Photobacterium ganghwense TaxID=320778 RepID=UPI001A8F528D|nr:hypothetical protein [Photobacterium ganghwense]QSV17535.1 hypothetical protein FH974_25860 [Photobacterium ganghwense]